MTSTAPDGGPFGTIRVLDFSEGIAGAYCARLLADAGADVVKIEPEHGDAWRTWSVGGASPDREQGGALFRFLHHGMRSVVGAATDAEVGALIAGADVLIESGPAEVFDGLALRGRHPGLVWLSITPFGRTGPYADRPSTEFTVQAEAGGILGRGAPEQMPIMAGGRISEWVSGTFAAVAAGAAVFRALRTGHGEHIDLSIAETMTIAGANYAEYTYELAGRPEITKVGRTFETPSIEPTVDGYVGFNTNSRVQFDDFLLLIGRPDLIGDEHLARVGGRQERWEEWNEIVHAWTTTQTTAEAVRLAAERRIPVAPVHDAAGVLACEHFAARRVFRRDPTDTFTMPRPPWRMNDVDPALPRPSPRLGEHTGRVETRASGRPATPVADAPALPLAGLRVLDLTGWWAGPLAAGAIATLGADVIHIESIGRPDGMRMTGAMFGMRGPWWERSSMYLCANANKRNVTLDLMQPEGMALLEKLIATSDAVIENYSPRVMDNFGLSWEKIRAINPSCLFVRMPAFGLSGPWRNNTGFAQTMEQVTGLAWLTGQPWDQPRIQRGPSDPNAGMHAAFALVAGLAQRDRTGEGALLEVTMVEGALNAAAELVIEYSAYGNSLQREGNRVASAAPQGLYRCRGFDAWLALSVANDAQWGRLRGAIGDPAWARDDRFATHAGRRRHHDQIDEHLQSLTADCDAVELADRLLAAGVPASAARDPRRNGENPQLQHRRFYERVEHPVVGNVPTPTMPFRFAGVNRWLRCAAPTMGQHNVEVLRELGLGDEEIATLEAARVIGTEPLGR